MGRILVNFNIQVPQQRAVPVSRDFVQTQPATP